MKILLVNKFLYPNGGSETYIFQLGEAMRACGDEVEYFGMEHTGRIVGNRVNAYTTDMDFHGGSKLSKLTYPFKTIYSKEARKKIRLVLDNFQPDVVHLNNFNYQLTPSVILEVKKWAKQNKRNVKIVFTAHDYQLVCPNHMMYNPNEGKVCNKCLGGKFFACTKGRCIHGSRAKSFIGTLEGRYWKRKRVYRHLDAIVCCSRFLKEQMDTNRLFANKTVALHNFINREEVPTVQKEDYVLYFGRFSKEKGIETLIQACKELPQVSFVFAGGGPLEGELSNLPNVKNVGFQTGESLKTLIAKARFSVYPSEWYENCPFSVMESQAYATPVLGANIGGIPELIEENRTGELFESGNLAQLKEKILALWEDRAKTDAYSQNCKQLRFDSLETYYEKLKAIYTE